MVLYTLLVSLLFLNAALLSTALQHECVTYNGKPGTCRLKFVCATSFPQFAEISRSPCKLSAKQNGVCCPSNKPLPNVPKQTSEITPADLDRACRHSMSRHKQMTDFARDLANRNIVASPNTPVFWHARLFETTLKIFKTGQDATIVLEASKELKESMQMSKERAEQDLPKFDVLGTIISNTCPPTPKCPDPQRKYRTMDGSCNNLQHTDWGQTGKCFTRMVPPVYDDGVSTPRLSESKEPLPSPRLISTAIAPSVSALYNNLTILMWQWGQFIDHDLTHTPISKGEGMTDISCCTNGEKRRDGDLHPQCMPIEIPQNDRFFSRFNQRCMEFVRSMPAVRPKCKFGPREQMNQITSYFDGSNVYGSTDEEAAGLRQFQNGLLRVTMHQGRELLPGDDSVEACRSRNSVHRCFVAGDTRVNEQPDLTLTHTIWVRQHNRVARELAKLNPSWSDEILYQETRRIIAAQLQHITYNEYLPIVLGENFIQKFNLRPQQAGYFGGYNSNVDATIINSFATAAFRYGHTLITDQIQGFNKFGDLKDGFEISRVQFKPFSLYEPETLDSLIRGLSLQQSQRFDRFFSEQVTNRLLAQDQDFGMDLVSLNIQRGRDHGLAPYTKFRTPCNLSPVNIWEDLHHDMDIEVVNQLRSVYKSVHDIDIFIGGVSERYVTGTLLGPTLLCIIGQQFTNLKIGDRFYYENGPGRGVSSSFKENQLNEIRKTTLARILCDNSDDVKLMQPLAFASAHLVNKRVSCTDDLIPKMNLDPWKNLRV